MSEHSHNHLLVFGGSFNPIHIGHLRMMILANEELKPDKILLLPTGIPPHKVIHISNNDRLDLVKIAAKDLDFVHIDTREILNTGISRTIDTVKSLREEYKNSKLTFLLGEDSFNSLYSWHQWQDIIHYVNFAVFTRDSKLPINSELQKLKQSCSTNSLDQNYGQIYFLKTKPVQLSSSYIRGAIASNLDIRFLVTDQVMEIIKIRKLYTHKL